MKLNILEPNISEETMKEMAAFFMKTAIPRILAEGRKKEKVSDTNHRKRASA